MNSITSLYHNHSQSSLWIIAWMTLAFSTVLDTQSRHQKQAQTPDYNGCTKHISTTVAHSTFANKQHLLIPQCPNVMKPMTEVLISEASNTFKEFDYGLLAFLHSYKRNETNGNIRMQSIKHKSNQEICDTNHKRDTFYGNNHWIKPQKIFEISHARHSQIGTNCICVRFNGFEPRILTETVHKFNLLLSEANFRNPISELFAEIIGNKYEIILLFVAETGTEFIGFSNHLKDAIYEMKGSDRLAGFRNHSKSALTAIWD